MQLPNFAVDLDDETFEAARRRAQNEGKTLDQTLTELLTTYARSESGGSVTTYTVKRGDTLSKIARQVYGDPYKYPLIQQANNITDPGRIWVGQVLVIPPLAGAAPQPQPAPAPSPPPAPQPPPAPSPPTPAPSPPAPAPTPPQPVLADYVRAMPSGFRADKAKGLNMVYQFDLAGEGAWSVTVSNGVCTAAKGPAATPTVIIGMNGPDFIKLSQGQFNAVKAYQQGQVQVRGDLNVAAKITDIFGPWASFVGVTPAPTPSPSPPPSPGPTPPPAPQPGGPVNSTLLNGSFDDYQPYVRDGEAKFWKEPQFPEEYGAHWALDFISEGKGRVHMMNSGVFGKFTQKYFGGSGLDYHQHGRYSQVVTSRFRFDLVFRQTVAAQPGKTYTFSGMIVSFYKGTGGERKDNVIFKTIGIDPTGGRDWNSPTVVWGDRDGKDNEWRSPKFSVKAEANAITVFIRLENDQSDVGKTELNIVHLENFKLE